MTLYRYGVVILSVFVCVVVGTTSWKFRARKNSTMTEDLVNKTISTDGLMKCIMLCKSETTFMCEAASWGEGKCLLSTSVMINEDRPLEMNEHWTTMCRIKYQVFLAMGARGRYTQTFEEAKTRCQEAGSRIASRQDMLDARAMGFEVCSCGWLSDGTMGFVLQAPSDCWWLWDDGIIGGCIDSTSTADVFCVS